MTNAIGQDAPDRPQLTLELCQRIVVDASFAPGKFTSPAQQLRFLAVVDDLRAEAHRARIVKALERIHYTIRVDDISSGPVVSVADCRDSVADNAS